MAPQPEMRLTKWYSLALALGALTIAALPLLSAYLNARNLAGGSVSLFWVTVDICQVIASGSLLLIVSAFTIGMIDISRAPKLTPLVLTPAVVLLIVVAVVIVAEVISWYGAFSPTEMSIAWAGEFLVREVALDLGVGICLAGVLHLTIILRRRCAI